MYVHSLEPRHFPRLNLMYTRCKETIIKLEATAAAHASESKGMTHAEFSCLVSEAVLCKCQMNRFRHDLGMLVFAGIIALALY